ncbi:MAG: tRNA (adenosine(37)-N6)-dimethylallyltransferase MiaA [Chloroflexi bacterium]|nr:tRNA (adenosine(37)-N6)-dimethylallyltransferase MiaA [Chloroflexota bacterium]
MHATQEDPKRPLLVIAGPTATGKTALALELANHAPIEVISADSRQVYRRLDIGTAKPTLAERKRVPHHLVDIIDPDEVFNAHRFAHLARAAIVDIETRGARPVVVGGTGFYIQALLTASPLGATPPDPDLRNRLTRELETHGPAPLIRRLHHLAPDRAAAIDLNNPRRLIRALEIAESQAHDATRPVQPRTTTPIPAHVLGLEVKPEILAERIAQRTEQIFQNGLLDEARRLRDRGYDRTLPALTGVGYAEALAHLDGQLSLAEAIQRTTIRTRQYARRQRTWFRHQLPTVWRPPNTALKAALNHLTAVSS